MDDTRQARLGLLRRWYDIIRQNCVSGAFTGTPFDIRANSVCGPRAGALELSAGGYSGPLMAKLTQHDAAILRQLVPWDFPGEPGCFMHGRYVRVEAGWPTGLADTMFRLDRLGRCPGNKGNRWTVGVNEHGARVTTSLKDETPHFLFGGQTGSGKSVSMRSAVLQLAKAGNELALVDGKYGDSLRIAEHLPGVVGPLATDLETAKSVLSWAIAQMKRRYLDKSRGADLDTRLIVFIDEFQQFTTDDGFAGMLCDLTSQGRGAGVHVVAATQYPLVSVFGGSVTGQQLTGRLALAVRNFDASKVVVGGATPRADHLLGKGDAYIVVPGACHRVQCAYVDPADFAKADTGTWQFDEWPPFDAEDVGQNVPTNTSGPTVEELAFSLLSAAAGEGRPTFKRRFDDAGLSKPGNSKAARLLKLGRDVWAMVEDSPELAAFCRDMPACLDN